MQAQDPDEYNIPGFISYKKKYRDKNKPNKGQD